MTVESKLSFLLQILSASKNGIINIAVTEDNVENLKLQEEVQKQILGIIKNW